MNLKHCIHLSNLHDEDVNHSLATQSCMNHGDSELRTSHVIRPVQP